MKRLLIVFLALFFWQCSKSDKEKSTPKIKWDMQRLDRTFHPEETPGNWDWLFQLSA
jgi:hypothetical protein